MKKPKDFSNGKTIYDLASELEPNPTLPEDCTHMKVKLFPVLQGMGPFINPEKTPRLPDVLCCVFCGSPLSRIKPGTKGLLPQ